MKKIPLLGLAFFSLLLSCESEGDIDVTERSEYVTVKSGNSDFAKLFVSRYTSGYTVGERKVISKDNTVYYTNVVKATIGSSQAVVGYILQTPQDSYYYEHDAAAKRITQFNLEGGKYLSESFTVGNDPVYDSDGFSPDNNVPMGRRFWGWDYSGPSETLYGNEETGCYRLMTETYYVFGVGVSTRELEDLRMPADCP